MNTIQPNSSRSEIENSDSHSDAHRSGVFEVNHPLIKHHLSRLRSVDTPPHVFRRVTNRLATLLAYEATKDLQLEEMPVTTPLVETVGHTLSQRIGLIPILRAGLGMVDSVLELIPTAEVWHLGLYRDEETAQPVNIIASCRRRNLLIRHSLSIRCLPQVARLQRH